MITLAKKLMLLCSHQSSNWNLKFKQLLSGSATIIHGETSQPNRHTIKHTHFCAFRNCNSWEVNVTWLLCPKLQVYLNVNITFKYLKLSWIAMVQLHMLLRVTYYEQQDLFDHEGVDFRRWTDNLHCRRKKKKL